MEAIGIVGWKNSGKTTLITRLIPALRRRGLTASTIKHVHHDVDLDQPGKDTYAHRQAGAVDVVMYSQSRWALLHEVRDPAELPDLADLMGHMAPVDIVLVEGFKTMPIRKVEVRGDAPLRPVLPAGEPAVIAVVADGETDVVGTPVFRRDDVEGLADLIAETVLGEGDADVDRPRLSGGRLP
jgi:molybdopterin-guanine dinucleotide biosynthesis protein B